LGTAAQVTFNLELSLHATFKALSRFREQQSNLERIFLLKKSLCGGAKF
jgi:hypothetical protein